MSNDGKEFGFVPFGIFGSVIVGIGMIVGGAVSGNFTLSIVGVVVMVCGIGITIACVVARAIKSAKRDNSNFEREIGDALRNSYRAARTGFENHGNTEESDAADDYAGDDEDEIPLEEIVARMNKRGETVGDVSERDDALIDLLYQADREDLADKYYDTVNEVWNCISDDEYGEYAAFIDCAIDTFYKIYCDEIDENSAISRLNEQKSALFAEKIDEPTSAPEPETDDGATEEADENFSKVVCDEPAENAETAPTETVAEQPKTDSQAVGESEIKTVPPHETVSEYSHAERHVEPKEHSSTVRNGAARINYKPIKKK